MTCRRSDNGLCADPHYCAVVKPGSCWLDDRSNAFADKMLTGTSETQRRYDNGPVCARCKYIDFKPDDLPYWYLEPPTPEQGIRAATESFEIKVCPVIRRRITASSGKQCNHFEMDPRKAP